MNYVTSIFSSVKGYYDGINGATLTGALDVIVVRQPDGTFLSSPFHVRFGKLNVLQSAEKLVDITVNGRPVSLQMKLGANGEAFFVKTVHETDAEYQYLDTSTSPIQTDSPMEMMRQQRDRYRQESTVTEDETEFSDSSSDQDEYYGERDRYGAEDCLSDSELLATQHRQQKMDKDINNRIVWDWGDLPHENRSQNMPAATSADEEETSFMRGMWDYMGRGRRKRKNTFSGTIDVQEGMFLDDIDTEDPGAVSHYFGVQTSRRSSFYRANESYSDYSEEASKNEEKMRRLDALSLEAPRYYMNTTSHFSATESSEEDTDDERARSLTYNSLTEDMEDEVGGPKYIKTVRLSSEQLASLELNEGSNVLTFSVTTSYQGTTKCFCHVYLWEHTDKVIISDIDGTITRSDVFGHILPWVGKDWTQNNIAQLFSALHNNGYKFLYLSSRAIGQASMTKNFLKSIKQNGVGIPEGPMLLSPDSLLRAFKVELVLRRPDIFKIKCLSDIKGLFGEDGSPFYAGFGNKGTDSKSYQAVGIPPHRTYRINHRGEIYTENSIVQHCTYAEIYDHNEVYFPIVRPEVELMNEEFLAQNFWRPHIPEINEDDMVL